MKKDIQLLIEKLNNVYKERNLWKKFVSILSCIAVFLTVYFLTSPAITLDEEKSYTFILKDSYDYDWKDSFTTEYNLNLYFMDTNGNYIEGKDITLNIGPDSFVDDPYGFGYVPTSGDSTRGLDLIAALDLEEIVLTTGEKYVFEHAEVYVNDTWQMFLEDSAHWDIWCQYASSSTLPDNSNYGWRGKYGNDVGYNVTSTTEYKFVYKLVRQGQSNIVDSLGADSGISFNIFNYSGDNSETGVNNNGVYEYFTFRGMGGSEGNKINATLDADGFGVNRAKVLSKLENGNPVFNCGGQCTNFSLGYLFGEDTNPIGLNVNGVTSYSPVNTLLQKDINDGYYYYDSGLNAVDYDIDNNRFMVRNYSERSYKMTTYLKEPDRYEFLPFNYWTNNEPYINSVTDTTTNTTVNRTYNYKTEELDHWFGMTMEFSFYMPKDGKINGENMIFSFSGDDDVWVFIDDVLVLDLGGTHGAVDGTINFATGEVESYLNWNGVVGTTEAGTANYTNIYEMFNNANSTSDVNWNDVNTTFNNYTRHTLKFFYLERGATVSNCKIRFNIPVLPSGSLSVQKLFEGIDNYNEDYEFTLYDTTNATPEPVTNTKYTIGDTEYETDINGKFTLKTNEVAIFKLINGHKYYVKETNTGDHAISYNCSLDSTSCPNINQTSEFIINPESSYQAIFTNKVKTFNLKISKIAYDSESDEVFEFKLNLKDKNNLPIDIKDDVNSKYIVDHTNGIVTFNLKNEEEIIINDIPIDTIITLEETKHDGYQTIIKTKDIVLANGDTYEFTMDSDKDITVHNISGVMLPETGGVGIYIYLFIGLCLILISFKFGYSYFFNVKEGEI